MKQLKSARANNAEAVETEVLYHICVSKLSQHTHSTWATFMNQQLDEKLKDEIRKCVSDGIINIRTIQLILKNHVKRSISGTIPTSSRSFYPSRKIIYNYVFTKVEAPR